MAHLARRTWTPEESETYVQRIADETARIDSVAVHARIDDLIAENRQIHEADCINLNPATNIMNPKAEAALASGLGSRPSLGTLNRPLSEPAVEGHWQHKNNVAVEELLINLKQVNCQHTPIA